MLSYCRVVLAVGSILLALGSPSLAQEAAAPASTAAAQPQAPTDEERLRDLQAELVTRQAEYDAAVKELSQLQNEVTAQRKDHEATAAGSDKKAIDKSEAELEALEARLRLAQERVDLAISERRSVRALIAQLEKKIELDKEPTKVNESTDKDSAAKSTDESSESSASDLLKSSTGLPATPSEEPAEAKKKTEEPISQRVAQAEATADRKSAEANQARQEAELVEQRKAALEANIELERKRLENSYQRHDNLSQTLIRLEEQLTRRLQEGKEFAELTDLTTRRDETREQLTVLSQEIKDQNARVEQLQGQLVGLQQEQLLAAKEVKDRESEAEVARRNQWLVTVSDYAIVTLPRVAIILVVLFLIYFASRLLGRRLITFLSNTERGTPDEREYRTQTLTGVFENAVTTALYVVGGLMVLDALKVPVSTLLGGVAVVGLAVAFGAQNLIRDYFYGFMILLEDQYKIKDVVTINNMTGQVERITLRITVLRDFEGKVYFIPNGQVNSVINQTHEWSRVVLDVPVSYSEKAERVMGILLELAEALARDPGFQNSVLREPELFGVEKLTDSAVLVRVCLVVRPTQKDTIRRELLRRIKSKFDELGIEIPFPQQTVHLERIPAQRNSFSPEQPHNGAGRATEPIEQA